jgi:HPt (histidine-containing phosphotransfer) domain-containing protein
MDKLPSLKFAKRFTEDTLHQYSPRGLLLYFLALALIPAVIIGLVKGNVMSIIVNATGFALYCLAAILLRRGLAAEAPTRMNRWLNSTKWPLKLIAALLVAVSAAVPGTDEEWALRFASEADRIHLGTDPALIAARKRVVDEGDVDLQHADDVLPNVLSSMLRELPVNAERLGAAVRELVATRNPAPIDEARRVAHTLKGDANTVGIRGLANLTHSLEDVLIE